MFPEELCDFSGYVIPGENWWDGNALVRIDLSNNCLESISADLGNQSTLQHILIHSNKIKSIPPSLFKLEKLKVLDLSNN